jgi:hypothetical protein
MDVPMPQRKKKYLNPPQVAPAPAPQSQATPYSFDLKGASQYTGFSVWALRKAILAGELLAVNPKPYIVRRMDVEKFIDTRSVAA